MLCSCRANKRALLVVVLCGKKERPDMKKTRTDWRKFDRFARRCMSCVCSGQPRQQQPQQPEQLDIVLFVLLSTCQICWLIGRLVGSLLR